MGIREMSRTLSKGIVSLAIAAGAFFLLSGIAGATTYTVTLAGDEVSDDPVYTTEIKVTIEKVGETKDTEDAIINQFTLTSQSDFYGKERVLRCKVNAVNPKVYLPDPPPPGPGDPPAPPPPSRSIWWDEPEAQEIFATFWRVPLSEAYIAGMPMTYYTGEAGQQVQFVMPYEGSEAEILEEPSLRAEIYAEHPDLLYRELQRRGMSEEDAYALTQSICGTQQGVYDILVERGVDPAVASALAIDSSATPIDLMLNGQAEDGTRGYYYQTLDGDKIIISYGYDPTTSHMTIKVVGMADDLAWNLGSGNILFDNIEETEKMLETRKGAVKSKVGKEEELASIDDVRRADYSSLHQMMQNPFLTAPGELNANSEALLAVGASGQRQISPATSLPGLSPYLQSRNSSLIDRVGLPRNQRLVNPSLYNPPPAPIISPVIDRTTPSYALRPNRNNTQTTLMRFQPRPSIFDQW